MHESRNKMQPEISLGTPGLEERVIITDGAALFSTRWLVRGDQRGWAVAAISAGWNVLYFFNASTLMAFRGTNVYPGQADQQGYRQI